MAHVETLVPLLKGEEINQLEFRTSSSLKDSELNKFSSITITESN